MKPDTRRTQLLPLLAVVALTGSLGATALAAEPQKTEPKANPSAGAERVNVDSIKEKYWAQGNESELGVVQNRLYSKAHKFELGLFGGMASSDPFFNVTTLGTSLGFHFSEYIALHAFGWRSFAKPSSALEKFQEFTGQPRVNNNEPRSFLGGELSFSPIYGKLSLMGQAIIYYDMHLTGGAGVTFTEFKNALTPFVGIGQQVYLAKWMSLKLDYHVMRFTEPTIEKISPSIAGKNWGDRVNWTHAITLGVSVLFGLGK